MTPLGGRGVPGTRGFRVLGCSSEPAGVILSGIHPAKDLASGKLRK